MKLNKYIYYLNKLNNKIKHYKDGDDLNLYLKANDKILKGGIRDIIKIKEDNAKSLKIIDDAIEIIGSINKIDDYFTDDKITHMQKQLKDIENILNKKKDFLESIGKK